jgi:pimeloyl-ACP methyl ester carboxylesterase
MRNGGRCIDVGGHALRVAVYGVGPPRLVCLHGLAGTLEIWGDVAPALAARAQVVLVDQRAHGRSEAPPGPYRREDLAADVCGVLERLGIAQAVLVGHSMGGIVAMTTALAYPDRVAGLVLLGTASECSRQVAAWYEKIARAAETEGLAGFARAIFGPASAREVRGDPQGLGHVTRCLKSLADDPLTPRLAGIACPTLLVVGEKDPMGVGASVIIERHLPSATLEVVPAGGHWMHVEAPGLLVATIERFLCRHFPGAVR